MKQLIKNQIIPYLPYNLKAEMLDYEIDYVNKRYDEIVGIHQWDKNSKYWSVLTVGGSKPEVSRIKPILRHLRDLFKEIEVQGEKMLMCEKLNLFGINYFEGTKLKNQYGYVFEISNLPFDKIQKLLELHFNIFGLIEKGLAIDINTLNE